jgi:hypothetical protein
MIRFLLIVRWKDTTITADGGVPGGVSVATAPHAIWLWDPMGFDAGKPLEAA